jgi:hypothetical protein
MLANRTHFAIQLRHVEHAEQPIDRTLGFVDSLDYWLLNAKSWYWKGLVTGQRGSAKEAAEAFFSTLERVDRYVGSSYLRASDTRHATCGRRGT